MNRTRHHINHPVRFRRIFGELRLPALHLLGLLLTLRLPVLTLRLPALPA